MKRCKTIPSQTLMPIRKATRAVQGTVEDIMLLAQAFVESAERYEVCMGYSTYSHEALTRNIHILQSDYEPPLDIGIALNAAFVTWLLYMGRLQPYLHDGPKLYTMLVAFGLVVQRGDITCFPNIKVRATSLVSKRHVTSPVEIRNWDMPAEKLVQRLAVDVTQNSQASVTVAVVKEEEYLLQEATCIANFLETYALPLS
ncbi:hypothetical protein KCU77_g12388, partial [Aureobasidium melanogenum]